MKMVTIICRERLQDSMVKLLTDVGVKGYTVMSGLGGRGKNGAVSEHNWTDRNVSFVVAVEDHHVPSVTDAVKQLYARLLEKQSGEEVPIKVFLQPCEVVL
ncbi:P-II family nitrogen regulator [Petrachloros mirabilis]